jgi:hypothetical protein
MSMSPPMIRRMIQKARRLAASLGIDSRPPMGDAAAGVRSTLQSADELKIPAAHARLTGRGQVTSSDGKRR